MNPNNQNTQSNPNPAADVQPVPIQPAQPQNQNQVFTQTGDAPPVPSQSVQQPQTPAVLPPAPKKKGGFLKFLIFLILLIFLGFGGFFAFNAVTSNKNSDDTISEETLETDINDEDQDSEDTGATESGQIETFDAEQIEDESLEIVDFRAPQPSPALDVQLIAESIVTFYDSVGQLPDTDNNPDILDLPLEWTCIGTAPQCYDLNEAGQETETTVVPDFLDETPIYPESGYKQETGYELIFNLEDSSVSVRSILDTSIISTRNFSE